LLRQNLESLSKEGNKRGRKEKHNDLKKKPLDIVFLAQTKQAKGEKKKGANF